MKNQADTCIFLLWRKEDENCEKKKNSLAIWACLAVSAHLAMRLIYAAFWGNMFRGEGEKQVPTPTEAHQIVG